jgi:hypothetical protein
MALLNDEQIRDLVEELQLLRAGKPFHTHVDLLSGQKKRCSSPYCVDLTPEGERDGPRA